MEYNIEDLITDYLTGALDAETRADFEARIAADPQLAARVALELEVAHSLSTASPENLLRSNLRDLAEKFSTPESLDLGPAESAQGKTWLWWVLAAALLIVAGLFFLTRAKQEKPMKPTPPAPQIELQTPAPTKDLPQTNGAEKLNAKQKQPEPIAAAFKPIPTLETYIGSKIRSSDFRILVAEPQSGATLSARNGQTMFRLTGKIEGGIPNDKSFNVLIFSNNIQDFKALHPVESQLLEFDSNGAFHFIKKLSLPPGLYYLLIEDRQSGEWVRVDKFLVR